MIDILSIHVTDQCNMNPRCPFCYSINHKQRLPLKWFYGIPKVAKELGVKQIPIGGGEVTMYPPFLEKFTKLCRQYGIIPNLTTNGMNKIGINTLANLGCVSFSLDKYKLFTGRWSKSNDNNPLANLIYTSELRVTNERLSSLEIGLNYLVLDKKSLSMLPATLRQFNYYVDNFYILQPKNVELDYTIEEVKLILYPMILVYDEKIFVDDSFQLALGKKEYCHGGNGFLSLSYDGGVRTCSFAEPIAYIKKPEELKDVINNLKFPLQYKCKYVKV